MPNNQICGSCHYYANSPLHGPWCSKNRKEVSFLQSAYDCFTEPGTAPAEAVQTKVCSKCGRELPVSEFGRHSRTKDGYQPCCRECLSKQNSGHRKRKPFEHNEAPAKPEEPETIPEGMTEFRRHKKSPDGLQYACKECQVEMTTKAKQKRTENRRPDCGGTPEAGIPGQHHQEDILHPMITFRLRADRRISVTAPKEQVKTVDGGYGILFWNENESLHTIVMLEKEWVKEDPDQ